MNHAFLLVGLLGGLGLGAFLFDYAPVLRVETQKPVPKIENTSKSIAVDKHFGVPSSQLCYAAKKEVPCTSDTPEMVCGTWTGTDRNDPYAWQVSFCLQSRAGRTGVPAGP
jgi:hypothetical protein